MTFKDWIPTLQDLLASQPLGVLSTHGPTGPHASLVAFAASEELREILFATARGTVDGYLGIVTVSRETDRTFEGVLIR